MIISRLFCTFHHHDVEDANVYGILFSWFHCHASYYADIMSVLPYSWTLNALSSSWHTNTCILYELLSFVLVGVFISRIISHHSSQSSTIIGPGHQRVSWWFQYCWNLENFNININRWRIIIKALFNPSPVGFKTWVKLWKFVWHPNFHLTFWHILLAQWCMSP